MSDDPTADPEARLRELHEAKLAARAAEPNWPLRIGLLTFVGIPLAIVLLPKLISPGDREEKGLERALHYCDDAVIDRCAERVTERHEFCFEYGEDQRKSAPEIDFYGRCMHSMYPDFYLKVGDNILEK